MSYTPIHLFQISGTCISYIYINKNPIIISQPKENNLLLTSIVFQLWRVSALNIQ